MLIDWICMCSCGSYSRPVQNASRKNAETSGLELYALVGVVLLCGIFILEALQLAAILL